MSFLPLVERELRVASRQRVTFWLRIIAALVALILGAGCAALTWVGMFPFSTASLGKGLFTALTWIGLVAALLAGPFLTSDCLSGEKREGTLGLLFLTDLRGPDVVLGKLFATALRAGYALLALLPVLAMTFTMGGVSGAQFGKTALALAQALFLSLAAGQLVSSFSREAPKALGGTLVLLGILVFGGPFVDGVSGVGSLSPVLSWTSPGFLFLAAGDWGSGPFWIGLLAGQILGWGMLAAAGFILRRTWQDKGRVGGTLAVTGLRRWWPGRTKNQAIIRNQLLNMNPVSWLMGRRAWGAGLLWVMTLVLGLALAGLMLQGAEPGTTLSGLILHGAGPGTTLSPGWMIWSQYSTLFTLLLYLGAASQAVRFHVEARRSGLLELILTTPLTVREIIDGQWRGLFQRFGPPLLLGLLLESVGQYQVQRMTWNLMSAVAQATPVGAATNTPAVPAGGGTGTNTVTSGSIMLNMTTATLAGPVRWGPLVSTVFSLVSLMVGLVTLTGYGLWRGLISKGVNGATLTTLLYVQVIPWFIIAFMAGMTIPLLTFTVFSRAPSRLSSATLQAWIPWIPFIMTAVMLVLNLIKDAGFLLYARTKLFSEFRDRAIQVSAPVLGGAPPVLISLNRLDGSSPAERTGNST